MLMMAKNNNNFDLNKMNTSLTTQHSLDSLEMLNDQNIEHTNNASVKNLIQAVSITIRNKNTISVFNKKLSQNGHQVIQLNKSQNQNCPKCGKFFRIKKSLKRHLWQVHSTKSYSCKVNWCCTDSKGLLMDYIRTFHNVESDPPRIFINQQLINKYQQPEHQSLMDSTIDDVIYDLNLNDSDIAARDIASKARECRIDDAKKKVDKEMKSIESSMNRWSCNEVEKCWELMKNDQINGDEENVEVRKECDDDETEVGEIDKHDQHGGNDEKLLKDSQMEDDEENENGADQLNGLEHEKILDGAKPQKQIDLTGHFRMQPREELFKCTWINCNKTFVERSELEKHSRIHFFTFIKQSDSGIVTEKDAIEHLLQRPLKNSSLHSSPTPSQPSSQSLHFGNEGDLSVVNRQIDGENDEVDEIAEIDEDYEYGSLIIEYESEVNGDDDMNEQIENDEKELSMDDDKMDDDGHDNEREQLAEPQLQPNCDQLRKNFILARDTQTSRSNLSDLSVMNVQMDGVLKNYKVSQKNDHAEVEHINEDVVLIEVVERPNKRMKIEEMEGEKKDVMDNEDDHVEENEVHHGPQRIDLDLAQNVPNGKVVPNKSQGKHICEYCGKGFTRQYSLTVHNGTHTGDRPFRCTWAHCGKAFGRIQDLESHECKHTGNKPHKCPWEGCNKAFIQRYQMLYHLKVHTELPFVCENCLKRFKIQSELNDHILTCIEKRPYKCTWDKCNSTFTKKCHMQVHLKAHQGLLPHVCQQCGKGFGSPFKLKSHIRVHTGERPFKCEWNDCEKAFKQKIHLNKHFKSHTPTPE